MLIVLFIIMAIAVISSGFIARSDAELQCGRNYRIRNEADYLAWAALEHAKAMVISPENTGGMGDDHWVLEDDWSQAQMQIDAGSSGYYDLVIESPVETAAADPNDLSTYTYSIRAEAYDKTGSDIRASSALDAILFYDPNGSQAYYISVTRQCLPN